MDDNYLILDFETTNTDPETCTVVQTGLLLVDSKMRILKRYSAYHKVTVKFQEDAKEKCGITQERLNSEGKPPEKVFSFINKALQQVKGIITHNGTNFDLPILKRVFKTLGHRFPDDLLHIDTRYHVPYPEHIKTRALLYLCAEHNFLPKDILPGSRAHDALTDCTCVNALLAFYDFDEIKRRAKSRMLKVEACSNYEQREMTKQLGFHPEYKDGKFFGWFKEILECDLEVEKTKMPFKLAVDGEQIS